MLKALMVDVDGVLVHGRPDDGRHWATSLETDMGLRNADLQREFFAVHWDDIVVGRAGLMERLPSVLSRIAPHLDAAQLIAYWFANDSRVSHDLLRDLARARAAGTPVYLATNQERMRAEYLLETVGLAEHVDGIYYSAQLGAKKPDRAFFDKVVSKMNVAAGELLLIDDCLVNIAAASAAGWNVIHWGEEKSLGDLVNVDHRLMQ
jgi:putative hydrolase of the HAD superfamily